MSLLHAVEVGLKNWPQPQADGESVVVPTHLLYPSMSVVKTRIEGGMQSARVSDDCGAYQEASSTGDGDFDILRYLKSKADDWELTVAPDGRLTSPEIAIERVGEMVAWVANASHSLATDILSKLRPKARAGDFRGDVDAVIRNTFRTKFERDWKLVGASNKPHKFDYFISSNGPDKGLLIDTVLNDGSSINSKIVAHLDVAKADHEGIVQRIIFDDRDDWKASDLSLLRVGATPVAYSKMESAIKRALMQ